MYHIKGKRQLKVRAWLEFDPLSPRASLEFDPLSPYKILRQIKQGSVSEQIYIEC